MLIIINAPQLRTMIGNTPRLQANLGQTLAVYRYLFTNCVYYFEGLLRSRTLNRPMTDDQDDSGRVHMNDQLSDNVLFVIRSWN